MYLEEINQPGLTDSENLVYRVLGNKHSLFPREKLYNLFVGLCVSLHKNPQYSGMYRLLLKNVIDFIKCGLTDDEITEMLDAICQNPLKVAGLVICSNEMQTYLKIAKEENNIS